MRSSFRGPALTVVLVGAVVLTCTLARAAEPDEAKLLVEKLEELRKAEDVSGLASAIGQVPTVYKGTENKSARGKLCASLGKIVKDDDLGAAREAAIRALTELDDPKPAWKELSRVLPTTKVEEPTPVDFAVVKAAGVLAQSRAVKPLLELAAKAKQNDLAKAAIEALGGYRADKKGRVKILEELIDIGKRTRPGRSTEKAVSKEAQERWAALGPAIVTALNRLTGQNVISFEDWEALHKDNKKRPQALFVDDD